MDIFELVRWNEERQFNKMIEKGIEARRIFTDKASGKNFDRVQYQMLRKILNTGDLLYVDALEERCHLILDHS